MLSNQELTTRVETLDKQVAILRQIAVGATDIRTMLQQQIDDQQERIKVIEHELKIMKKIVNRGNLEQIPPADYEWEA